jgi:hypothetical protein
MAKEGRPDLKVRRGRGGERRASAGEQVQARERPSLPRELCRLAQRVDVRPGLTNNTTRCTNAQPTPNSAPPPCPPPTHPVPFLHPSTQPDLSPNSSPTHPPTRSRAPSSTTPQLTPPWPRSRSRRTPRSRGAQTCLSFPTLTRVRQARRAAAGRVDVLGGLCLGPVVVICFCCARKCASISFSSSSPPRRQATTPTRPCSRRRARSRWGP